MFPAKKKPAVGVTIAIGKKTPPPLDLPGKKPAMGMGMMGAGKPAAAPVADPAEGAAHEAAETPDYESQEDAGAQITTQIDTIFADEGIDPEQGRGIAAKLFAAVAKALTAPADTGEDGAAGEGAGDTGDYPA